jgi:replicative DNA helicase
MIEQSETIDTLEKFGRPFQTKCIIAMMTDREFTEQISDVINPFYFESEADRWIVDKIFWYFGAYRALPTQEVFKKEVDKLHSDSILRPSTIQQLTSIFKTTPSDDLKYIKDEFLAFCKNQALKNAVLKSADLLQSGKYDQIKVIIDKAMNAGLERNLGHHWNEDMEKRMNKITRNVVATPWECINNIIDGGLGAGELGCFVAPSGIGKSWLLSSIGAHAIRIGKKVAHFTFELQEDYVGLRYDTIFTGIEPNKVHLHQNVVREKMQGISGQLFIKYFPTRSSTYNTLMAYINRITMLGHAPDLVLVDYADLMRSSAKADARHEELGFIHEEIRGMLGELRIPGWTASQSQRSSLQDDVVEADKIAGSYMKIMTDDLVVSLSRKVADKMTNTARVHIIKNRFGPDGLTFPAQMDLAKGMINIFDENSPQGIMTKQQMQSGEGVIKAMLAKKLVDHRKNTP